MKRPAEDKVLSALRKRYHKNSHLILSEVRNSTGFPNQVRSADYVVVGLWPSQGLGLTGIEVKSARSDWLRERSRPDKSQEIFRFCGYWYLLTTAPDVATLEEIPGSWGWMDLSSGKLVIRKGAPVLCPELYTPEFLASLLRNHFAGKVHEREVEQLVRESVEKAGKSRDQHLEATVADLRKQLQSLKDQVRAFEEASGVSVSAPWRGAGWGDARRVGEAVAKLLSLGEDAERYAREAYDRRRIAQVADRARVRLMDVVSDLESLGRDVAETEEVT